MKKRNVIIIGSAILAVAVILSLLIGLNNESVSVEARVKKDMEKIMEYKTETLISSNPYDYIDNEYYRDIVSMGMDAVEVLSKGVVDKEIGSLDGYVATIAVEEITGLDITKISGKSCETADEFWKLWDETIKEMPKKIKRKIEKNPKEVNLGEYGIFGQTIEKEIEEEKDGEIEIGGEKIKYNKEMKISGKSKEKISETEAKKAKSYIEKKIVG